MEKQELDELLALLSEESEGKRDNDKENFMSRCIKILWKKRWHFFISIPLVAIFAIFISTGMPKYYGVCIKLAPEMAGASSSMSGLGGLARSMGLSRSSTGQEEDAIIPMLYPDLMNSQTFLVSLFDIPVESKDGKIKTTYYDYLAHHQKTSWWAEAKAKFFNLFSFSDDEKPAPRIIKTDSIVNPTALNKHQSMIMKAIASKIVCDVDKKTMVISITVTDQDPVICTTVADSTCQRLQNFIIDYRTKKAKAEYEHMLEQTEIAKQEYEEAKDELAAFNDANWDLVDGDLIVQRQGMQNDVQLRFSAYSTMNTQLLMARSKLDEARPVFTVLDGAAVPLQPIGPRKKIFVASFVLFVCFIQTIFILIFAFRRERKKNKKKEFKSEEFLDEISKGEKPEEVAEDNFCKEDIVVLEETEN